MRHQMAIMVGLGLLFGLSGCTLVEKYEQYVENKQHQWCMSANWYDVGQSDGANGQSQDAFGKYVGQCGKFGISPSQQLWEQGRKVGITTQYCTEKQVRNFAKREAEFNYALCSFDQRQRLIQVYAEEKQRVAVLKVLKSEERTLQDIESRIKQLDKEQPTDPAAKRYARELRLELEEKHRSLALKLYEMRKNNNMCTDYSDEIECNKYLCMYRGY